MALSSLIMQSQLLSSSKGIEIPSSGYHLPNHHARYDQALIKSPFLSLLCSTVPGHLDIVNSEYFIAHSPIYIGGVYELENVSQKKSDIHSAHFLHFFGYNLIVF